MSNIYLERLRALSGKPMVQEPTKPTKGAYVGFVGCRTTGIAENETALALPDLLARHGGFPGIDWQGLALTDAQDSALWIVQRPDGLLTVLATVEPISKPLSYRKAWAARFTRPEPDDDCAPAAERQAMLSIARAKLRGKHQGSG